MKLISTPAFTARASGYKALNPALKLRDESFNFILTCLSVFPQQYLEVVRGGPRQVGHQLLVHRLQPDNPEKDNCSKL